MRSFVGVTEYKFESVDRLIEELHKDANQDLRSHLFGNLIDRIHQDFGERWSIKAMSNYVLETVSNNYLPKISKATSNSIQSYISRRFREESVSPAVKRAIRDSLYLLIDGGNLEGVQIMESERKLLIPKRISTYLDNCLKQLKEHNISPEFLAADDLVAILL